MEPTLQDGDFVLLDRFGPHVRPPERGDVLVVLQPNGAPAVKRVIGLPGDVVEIDGTHRDARDPDPHPVVLLEPGGAGAWRELSEPYLRPIWERPDFCCDAAGRDAGATPRPFSVPAGELWVLGDNRNVSKDSRSFGAVPAGRVEGRVVLRYWPAARAGPVGGRPVLTADAPTLAAA